jgi:hypothetical protein
MLALPLLTRGVEDALRVVRALGSHRYVAGRLHLVHAFALAALPDEAGVLGEACAWARCVLADPSIDAVSRDESLWRSVTDAELVETLSAFWVRGTRSRGACDRLRTLLDGYELTIGDHQPFDESAEDRIHPLLIDAGWELLPLAALHSERHRGAMAAFGDELSFESARFEEETAIPPVAHLVELPAFGALELLLGVDDAGMLAAPLVVWGEGNAIYLDYVARGVRRAARLPDADNPDGS